MPHNDSKFSCFWPDPSDVLIWTFIAIETDLPRDADGQLLYAIYGKFPSECGRTDLRQALMCILCGFSLGWRWPYWPNHTVPYHIVTYHTIPYHIIPYCTVLYYTVLYQIVPYHTMLYHTLPYHTILYHQTWELPKQDPQQGHGLPQYGNASINNTYLNQILNP